MPPNIRQLGLRRKIHGQYVHLRFSKVIRIIYYHRFHSVSNHLSRIQSHSSFAIFITVKCKLTPHYCIKIHVVYVPHLLRCTIVVINRTPNHILTRLCNIYHLWYLNLFFNILTRNKIQAIRALELNAFLY